MAKRSGFESDRDAVPHLNIIGELSDGAIEALAELLVDLSEREQQATPDTTARIAIENPARFGRKRRQPTQ